MRLLDRSIYPSKGHSTLVTIKACRPFVLYESEHSKFSISSCIKWHDSATQNVEREVNINNKCYLPIDII